MSVFPAWRRVHPRMKPGRYICGYSGHQPTHWPFFAVWGDGKWTHDGVSPIKIIPDVFMEAPVVGEVA